MQKVVYVPGRVVNRMTGVFQGETNSDGKDSWVIAETARRATDDPGVELTRLTAHREDLMADRVHGVNRLRELLAGILVSGALGLSVMLFDEVRAVRVGSGAGGAAVGAGGHRPVCLVVLRFRVAC